MVNVDKLIGTIYEHGLKKGTFAQMLGKKASWLSGKLKNKNFTVAEAGEIAKVLNLTSDEASDIFFSQLSHKCDK